MLIGAGTYLFFQLSPWPSAMLIRNEFKKGTIKTNEILEKYAPNGISVTRDIHYDPEDPEAYLDIYYPQTNTQSGTMIWVHGGGWLSGNKNDLEPWAKILAGRGFSVVTVGYSIAPEKHYPIPVKQVNRSLRYLTDHELSLSIDSDKFILAGDSAGAQIVAQIALITTNPHYSELINIKPEINKNQIKALLLNCGPYDLGLVDPSNNSSGAKLVRTFLWTYTGIKKFYDDPFVQYISIPPYVTPEFPPSFITAGNMDPLLAHSINLSNSLIEKSVPLDTLFYPDDHIPALGHEYQFDLDKDDAKNALDRMVLFAQRHLSSPSE
jgi:Esterase/lipase